MRKKILSSFYWLIDLIYLKADKSRIRRSNNIEFISGLSSRRGGKVAYGEWAHVIGIFQTLTYQSLSGMKNQRILDVGSGTGLLCISALPYIREGGYYTGIEVSEKDVKDANARFTQDNVEFVHFDLENERYSKGQSGQLIPWPVEDESQNLVTALSVWTHLREEHALYYMKEVFRVLKKGSKAIVTFFYLDEHYHTSLPFRNDEIGDYHNTSKRKWIFDQKAHESDNWYTTAWSRTAEAAIAVTEEGLQKLLEASGLVLDTYYPGNWKEIPGIYFQDIFILKKPLD